jgi:hypothetical protein
VHGVENRKVPCKLGNNIAIKSRTLEKKAADVYRWRKQRHYPTTVEKPEMEIRTLEEHILRLVQQHKLIERKGNGVVFSSLFSFWILVVAA